jgi:hypothetical protein
MSSINVNSFNEGEVKQAVAVYHEVKPARPPKNIKEEAGKILVLAMATVQFIFSSSTAPFLAKSQLVGESIKKATTDITSLFASHVMNSLLAFAMEKGSFTEERYWMRIIGADKNENEHMFVSFPLLSQPGNHAKLVTALSGAISRMLVSGYKNTMMTFVESGGAQIPDNLKKYFFTKGYYVDGFKKEDINDFKSDIDWIMRKMEENKTIKARNGTWTLDTSESKFFFKPGSSGIFS